MYCPSLDGESVVPGWGWTSALGFCVYNGYDVLDLMFGLLSLAFWSIALLPQIYQNYKTKSVESQSLLFWGLWVIGDTANLMGCLLTQQVIWNLVLAVIYSGSCYIAIMQYIWYAWMYVSVDDGYMPIPEGVAGNMSNRSPIKYGSTVNGQQVRRSSIYDRMRRVFAISLTTMAFAGTYCASSEMLPMVVPQRRLIDDNESHNTSAVIGSVLGWLMAVVYVTSRVPQLHKTITTQESRDLSANMFVFTFLGNVTQFLSLVLRPGPDLTVKYFWKTAPWTSNALFCGLQDLLLLVMIRRYKDDPEEDGSKVHLLKDAKSLKVVLPGGDLEEHDENLMEGAVGSPAAASLGTPTDRFFLKSPTPGSARKIPIWSPQRTPNYAQRSPPMSPTYTQRHERLDEDVQHVLLA